MEHTKQGHEPAEGLRVAEIVRTILKDAGEEGITVHDFFNHESLDKFSHPMIDEALRAQMNALNVTLGGTATRYCWVS